LISGSTDGLVCLYDVSKSNEDDALEQVFIEKPKSWKKTGFFFSRFIMQMDLFQNVVLLNIIQYMQ
jgi:hypothetical protein